MTVARNRKVCLGDETEALKKNQAQSILTNGILLIRRLWNTLIRIGTLERMTDVTNILGQIEDGDPSAAEKLLPLVFDELRKLAAQHIEQEKPGQTLQATALVHEAYLRLVNVEKTQQWNSRGALFRSGGRGDAKDSGRNGP